MELLEEHRNLEAVRAMLGHKRIETRTAACSSPVARPISSSNATRPGEECASRTASSMPDRPMSPASSEIRALWRRLSPQQMGRVLALGPRAGAGTLEPVRCAWARGARARQLLQEEVMVNLRTAKTLGLVLPPSLMARADQVIE